MLAALANLAERVARENGKEHASQVRVQAEGGHVLLVRLEGGGTLAATTGPDARVGLALYDMRNARGEVERVMGGGG
jgi:predicted regulator of Ras-like GTPase activity (Roadblock/LC7/MglB family)